MDFNGGSDTMRKLFYIALKRGRDVVYIYRPYAPKLGETIFYNGMAWIVTGFIPCEYFD